MNIHNCQRFILLDGSEWSAYVLSLTGGETRTWICIRYDWDPDERGWQGCWSRSNATHSEIVQLIHALSEKVRENFRVGPYGHFIGGTYFFDGWDAWGSGIPAPLISISIREIINQASSEDLTGD